jgi:hypothetical protein
MDDDLRVTWRDGWPDDENNAWQHKYFYSLDWAFDFRCDLARSGALVGIYTKNTESGEWRLVNQFATTIKCGPFDWEYVYPSGVVCDE